jgi:rubrerythrin
VSVALPDPADAIATLQRLRAAERAQAAFYRALAAAAEAADDAPLAERLQGLHADEQHHFSRLTARLLELGSAGAPLNPPRPNVPPLPEWEAVARGREETEVREYASLLAAELDDHTRALVEEILAAERKHAELLGGKWMLA